MGRLYGRAGRLTAQNGGFRPGQFGILLFERFLVGFQLALIFSYMKYSLELPVTVSADSAIPDIQIRERINWCDRSRPWHLSHTAYWRDAL